jgi:hypothetical protein
MTGSDVKTYAIDVNTSHTPEEGAHSPSWPNGLIIIVIVIIIIIIIIIVIIIIVIIIIIIMHDWRCCPPIAD